MKSSKLLLVAPALFCMAALTGCKGGNTPTPTPEPTVKELTKDEAVAYVKEHYSATDVRKTSKASGKYSFDGQYTKEAIDKVIDVFKKTGGEMSQFATPYDFTAMMFVNLLRVNSASTEFTNPYKILLKEITDQSKKKGYKEYSVAVDCPIDSTDCNQEWVSLSAEVTKPGEKGVKCTELERILLEDYEEDAENKTKITVENNKMSISGTYKYTFNLSSTIDIRYGGYVSTFDEKGFLVGTSFKFDEKSKYLVKIGDSSYASLFTGTGEISATWSE